MAPKTPSSVRCLPRAVHLDLIPTSDREFEEDNLSFLLLLQVPDFQVPNILLGLLHSRLPILFQFSLQTYLIQNTPWIQLWPLNYLGLTLH